ncbi:MAG: hypothetical protein Kow0081_4830 [Candidatus Dojkabacteria bacterium]
MGIYSYSILLYVYVSPQKFSDFDVLAYKVILRPYNFTFLSLIITHFGPYTSTIEVYKNIISTQNVFVNLE